MKAIKILGIDEVGRGPIAGPVCVAGVVVDFSKKDKNIDSILEIIQTENGYKDSKKLTPKQRENILNFLQASKAVQFKYLMSSSYLIDKNGITNEIAKLAKKITILFSKYDKIITDYGIRLENTKYLSEKKADEKYLQVCLASIVAKTKRDEYMLKIHKKYKEYDFASNKGYGTKKHIQAIKKYGLTKYHRKTFCTKILHTI